MGNGNTSILSKRSLVSLSSVTDGTNCNGRDMQVICMNYEWHITALMLDSQIKNAITVLDLP